MLFLFDNMEKVATTVYSDLRIAPGLHGVGAAGEKQFEVIVYHRVGQAIDTNDGCNKFKSLSNPASSVF